jgi:hypothetical protein
MSNSQLQFTIIVLTDHVVQIHSDVLLALSCPYEVAISLHALSPFLTDTINHQSIDAKNAKRIDCKCRNCCYRLKLLRPLRPLKLLK